MTVQSNEKMLAEIFRIYQPPLDTKPAEFRIYYDKDTNEILFFSQEELPHPYVITTENIYMSGRADLYKIVEGQLVRRDEYSSIKLQLRPNGSKFKSAKNDQQFAVDDSYTGAVEGWDLNG
jgi:hypothetical protein